MHLLLTFTLIVCISRYTIQFIYFAIIFEVYNTAVFNHKVLKQQVSRDNFLINKLNILDSILDITVKILVVFNIKDAGKLIKKTAGLLEICCK